MKNPRLNAVSALVVFILLYCAAGAGTHFLGGFLHGYLHLQGVRQRAALTLSMSVLLLWAMFLIVYLILRLRGQTLESIGWRGAAPWRGWLAAIVLLILYAGLTLAGPLRNAPYLSDWSLFRVITALAAGLSAGICEETIFRGFLMTQSRDAGLPVVGQILLSGLLFGLAHAGWGGLTGHVSMAALVGSVGTTFVLGVLFAVVYVMSRRSLLPVVVAHAGIDLLIEPWLILYALRGGFAA
ncbi:MAG: CPBP family intramembrane glutamic endopeptidase [Steroidobacteraceae bacterium]